MTKDFSDFRKTGKHQSESIAIIGQSCLFPGAENQAAYWAAIKTGLDAIGEIPADHWAVDDYFSPDPKAEDRTYGRRGGFLSPVAFEPLKYGIVPKDLSAIDTTQLLGLVAADMALADAGYGASQGHDHGRTAVMLGVTGALKLVVSLGSRLAHPQLKRALAESGVSNEVADEVLKRFANEFTPWQENSFPGLLGNVTAGRIANRLNLGGANLVVDAACGSSLAAVRQAVMELQSGQADLVVTGGVDTFSDPFMYTCFSKTPALSPTNDVRPYDNSGDGTILGEGIGILVLKRLADAQRDGDRIYAVIKAVGSSSDGKGAAIFAPTADGQVRAIRNAYDIAGFTPDTVELVEGHGTGTAVGDAVEVTALDEVFGVGQRSETAEPWCAIGSVKAQIGHTKATAGAAGLIKAALSLYFKTLPPNVKVKTPLPLLTAPKSPFHLSTQARPWLTTKVRRAGVSAFGFGGSNFHCLLEEASALKPNAEAPTEFEFLAFSGSNPAEVGDKVAKALAAPCLSWAAKISRAEFSAADSCRLLALANPHNFAALSQQALAAISRPNFTPNDLPENFFYGSGQSPTVGFIRPNYDEASQNMFRELAADWPQLHQALSLAAGEWAQAAPDQPALDLLLYPPDLASEERRSAWAQAFKAAEPRLLITRAICQGLENILNLFDLRPVAIIDGLAGQVDVIHELNRQGYQDIGFWIELGSSRNSKAKEALGGARVLTFEAHGGSQMDLAQILARLAASGLPLNLTAWPANPLEDESSNAAPEKSFTVNISGANLFTKPEMPPTQRRETSVPTPATSKAAPSLAQTLEMMASETARLHEEFLKHQAEALRLLGQSLDQPSVWPSDSLAQPEQSAPQKINASLEPLASSPSPAAAEAVLQVVADETGYPLAMLNMDMDLEADLGLDSIKKVEIMAILSETMPGVAGFGAETMNKALTLGDLVTLAAGPAPTHSPLQVTAPVTKAASTPAPTVLAQEPSCSPSGAPGSISTPGQDEATSADIWPLVLEVVSAETGYPKDMLNPEMRLGDDLGLDSIKMVEIASVMSERLPDAGPLSADILNEAHTLGDLAKAIAPANPGSVTSPAQVTTQAPEGLSAPAADLVLQVVSQETGYPLDMLSLTMNLEADLGLDSIKKVEIMAALSEKIPSFSALSTVEAMSGLETLGHLAALAAGGNAQPTPQCHPAAQPQPARAPKTQDPSVADHLLDVVAAETGYPKDMLSFEAALEADLGLDSIKKVEIMAALSEKMGDDSLASSSAEALNSAVTLGDLRDLLAAKATDPAAPSTGPASPIKPTTFEEPASPVQLSSIEPPKRKAGRPPKNSPPAFRADDKALQLETTTSSVSPFNVEMVPVALSKGSTGLSSEGKVVVVADPGPLAEALANLFAGCGQTLERVTWAETTRLETKRDIEGLILVWPGEKNDLSLPQTIFKTLQAVWPSLAGAASRGLNPLVMGLTFMGGSFGFTDTDHISAPICGALPGLLKTAAREWPAIRVRVLDLPLSAYGPLAQDFMAGVLAAASPAAPVELGLPQADKLTTPCLRPYKSKNIRVRHLREGQTLIVTGGARGVTAAAVKELAKSFKPRLVILGRTPISADEPKWLRGLSDESAIRQAIFNRAQNKPTPRDLAKQSSLIMAGREIKENIAAMEKAGAKVVYISGDFSNPDALRATMGEIKNHYGPIHGFIHGAGVLADSLIVDKTDEEFERVFSTKAKMASLIMAELAGQPINFVAFFSSSTARFGRRGQADYAAGNEVLNKLARAMSGNRQAPKCLSINWGPWAGGMVDASLSRLFESEGIGLIPLAEGARLFTTLAGGPKNDPVEVVVLGPNTNLTVLDGSNSGN